MIEWLLALILSSHGASSFLLRVVPDHGKHDVLPQLGRCSKRRPTITVAASDGNARVRHIWSPQDLTQDNPGYLPIPDNDYVKEYQAKPELWPVEFFVIAHRRRVLQLQDNDHAKKCQTQILVRKSANGTSQWGLGTGVPASRWMLSSSQQSPSSGYEWSNPPIYFEASKFPEFPKNTKSWTYQKINICQDAFQKEDHLKDPELEEYAEKILRELRTELEHRQTTKNHDDSSWASTRHSVIKNVADKANCLAAIQGTLRMSGMFAPVRGGENNSRYVSFNNAATDPAKLVESMRIFTMWPQMPDPMLLPSASSEELQNEINTRESRMTETSRDPHMDKYGRIFTHKSTSNVSNTIHGVYFTLDLTNLPGLEDVPAFDLFGTKEIKREWKSLEDLNVLDDMSGTSISTEDPKPTFISGFIVRQLVQDGIIGMPSYCTSLWL
jgi:hypothetical protein